MAGISPPFLKTSFNRLNHFNAEPLYLLLLWASLVTQICPSNSKLYHAKRGQHMSKLRYCYLLHPRRQVRSDVLHPKTPSSPTMMKAAELGATSLCSSPQQRSMASSPSPPSRPLSKTSPQVTLPAGSTNPSLEFLRVKLKARFPPGAAYIDCDHSEWLGWSSCVAVLDAVAEVRKGPRRLEPDPAKHVFGIDRIYGLVSVQMYPKSRGPRLDGLAGSP